MSQILLWLFLAPAPGDNVSARKILLHTIAVATNALSMAVALWIPAAESIKTQAADRQEEAKLTEINRK